MVDSSNKDWSANSVKITENWLKMGLKERCITRDLKWGVGVPGWAGKCFYVWFDAPIGYISISKKYIKNYKDWWGNPGKVSLQQFMGKDNVPFHSIIFPSCLLGTKGEWTMLHKLSVTEYLLYENQKFSKSKQVGVFGLDAIQSNIKSDIWRVYLLSIRPEGGDANFAWKDLQAKNEEVLENIGNLCNRIF